MPEGIKHKHCSSSIYIIGGLGVPQAQAWARTADEIIIREDMQIFEILFVSSSLLAHIKSWPVR